MTLFKMPPYKTPLLQWRHGLLVLPVALWLSANSVQAEANITCTASMAAGSINLGTITPVNADNASTTGTLSYNCHNSADTVGYASVCLEVDKGDSDPSKPRYMTGPDSSELAFKMTLSNGETWGDRFSSGTEYPSDLITIAGNSSFSSSTSIHVSLLSGQGNVNAKQGVHTRNFDGQHTALTVDTSTDSSQELDCSGVSQGNTRFPFTVEATVDSSCYISATSDISLGSHSAGSSIEGHNQNAITVTCINGMPYNIGLTPSNQNINGAGIMTSTSGYPDTIAYQLRSKSGSNGQPWGNTATANHVGNGVAGIGSGVPNSHTVYVTVPKTDVRSDIYSDIVSVTINY